MPFCIVRPGLDGVDRCGSYVLLFGALSGRACDLLAPPASQRASTEAAAPSDTSISLASGSSLANVR